MANWCEGTLKVRGKEEDVIRFFEEGVELHKWEHGENKNLGGCKCDSKWGEIHIEGEPWVVGTKRAFIGPDEFIFIEHIKDDTVMTFCSMREAWYVSTSEWCEISKKFDVDIRIHTYERGMQFEYDLEVIKGEITLSEPTTYDDYEWECPMPGLGG